MAIAKMMERLEALRRTKLYDLLAAAPVIAWFAYSVAQMLPPFAQRLALLKMFVQTDPSVLPASLVFRTVSEIMTLVFFAVSIVMFAVRYVPQQGTVRLYPRLVAVAGTFLSLGFVHLPPQELSPELYLISMLLLIAGTGFAIYAIFVLGRSISLLPEARRLVTRGPYALVRHPLYLGEMVAIAGIALQHLSAWSLLLLAVAWALLFQRMKYEEQVLAQSFPEYADYMARTARLVPGVY